MDVLEDEVLDRAPDQGWSIRHNLAHIAAVDRIVAEILNAPDVVVDAAPFLAARDERREGYARLGPADLRVEVQASRVDLVDVILDLDAGALGRRVTVQGSPFERGWTLEFRSYLAAWAIHDTDHELAIREALRSRISPGVLAATVAGRRQR